MPESLTYKLSARVVYSRLVGYAWRYWRMFALGLLALAVVSATKELDRDVGDLGVEVAVAREHLHRGAQDGVPLVGHGSGLDGRQTAG